MKVSLTTFMLLNANMVPEIVRHSELLLHELGHVPELVGTPRAKHLAKHIAGEVNIVYRLIGGLKYHLMQLDKEGDEGLQIVSKEPPIYIDGETYGEIHELCDTTVRSAYKVGRAFVAYGRGQLDFSVTLMQAHDSALGVKKIHELFDALYEANMAEQNGNPIPE